MRPTRNRDLCKPLGLPATGRLASHTHKQRNFTWLFMGIGVNFHFFVFWSCFFKLFQMFSGLSNLSVQVATETMIISESTVCLYVSCAVLTSELSTLSVVKIFHVNFKWVLFASIFQIFTEPGSAPRRRVRNSLSRTNSANIRRGKKEPPQYCACLWLRVLWLSLRASVFQQENVLYVFVGAEPSLHASVLPAASCVAAESRKSLWGRDKNGEAAPRTRSTSTTPDPS